jgi:putative two-component system response regulator
MSARALPKARVLIVDDQPPNVLLLEMMLRRAGYLDVRSTTDPFAVATIFAAFQPDILLLDLHMSGQDGFQVMESLRRLIGDDSYFPILVLTCDMSSETKQKALACGAKDFLTKPFDVTEVLLRIGNLLETRFLHLQLQDEKQVLEVNVQARTREIEAAQFEILKRLSLAAEYRDDDTGEHTQRVGRVSALLAQRLGIADEAVKLIRFAAPLHDVGKIGIADSILLKPDRLTPDEYRTMTTHTHIGARMLAGSDSLLLQLAEQIALTHHEHWDGGGYPLGLREDGIPLPSRIVSVADVFDALTHERPYKKAWTPDQAGAEIERLSRSKFDPEVVGGFLQLLGEGALKGDAVVESGGFVPVSDEKRHASQDASRGC